MAYLCLWGAKFTLSRLIPLKSHYNTSCWKKVNIGHDRKAPEHEVCQSTQGPAGKETKKTQLAFKFPRYQSDLASMGRGGQSTKCPPHSPQHPKIHCQRLMPDSTAHPRRLVQSCPKEPELPRWHKGYMQNTGDNILRCNVIADQCTVLMRTHYSLLMCNPKNFHLTDTFTSW